MFGGGAHRDQMAFDSLGLELDCCQPPNTGAGIKFGSTARVTCAPN